jgi:hypothetical protein
LICFSGSRYGKTFERSRLDSDRTEPTS